MSRKVSNAMIEQERFYESAIDPSNLIINKSYLIVDKKTKLRHIGYRYKGLDDNYDNLATFKRVQSFSGEGAPIMDDSVDIDSHKFYDINHPYLKDFKSTEYESSSSTDPLPDPLPDDGRAKKSRRSKSSSSSGTRRTIKNPTVTDIPRFRDGEAITFTRELLDRAQFFDMIRRDRTGQYEEDRGYPPERGIKFIFHKP
jgi:hypothetical protein